MENEKQMDMSVDNFETDLIDKAQKRIEELILENKLSKNVIKLIWQETVGELSGIEEVMSRNGKSLSEKRAIRMKQVVAWRALNTICTDEELKKMCSKLSEYYELKANLDE